MSQILVTPRARVLIVEDAGATRSLVPQPDCVRAMVNRAMTNLVGRTSLAACWRTFISTQDVVGLKVVALPGAGIGTRPAVVDAVIRGLIESGMAPNHILIWDRRVEDLRRAGYGDLAERHGVRLAGAAQSGWDESVFYETPLLGQLVYGDLEFGKTAERIGRKSFVSKVLTKEITKIINISPLLNNNAAGVSGNLYSLSMGCVDNVLRFESDTSRLAQAVPEIYALPAVGDRVVLNIVDALIAQYQGEHIDRLHYAAALNQIRFGTDPVAMDVLSLQDLDRLRETRGIPGPSITNYIDIYRNASLLEIGISDPRRIQVEKVK